MKLTRLCKSAGSTDEEDCPAVYVADIPTVMVGQGKNLDADTTTELRNVANDEIASAIPTETVLRAVGLFLARYSRESVLAEVEAFLAEWDGGQP